ncbi:hypothetical protein ABZW49_28265 [Nonomuraea wenchangensis]
MAVSRFADGGVDDLWGLNYGLDRVRFVSPVHLGDLIVPTFEVLKAVRKDPGYKILRRCTFAVTCAATWQISFPAERSSCFA